MASTAAVYDNGVYVHTRTKQRCWCGKLIWKTTFMGEPDRPVHRLTDAEVRKRKASYGVAGAWTGICRWYDACPPNPEVK